MSDLSELFGIPTDEGAETDFDAIFGDGAADAPPPLVEPKTIEAGPEASGQDPETLQGADVPAVPADNAPQAIAAEESAKTEEASKAAETAKSRSKSKKSKMQEEDTEPDLFSAFNEQEDTPPAPEQEDTAPAPEQEANIATAPGGQVSLFDKPPVFYYGSAREPIEDTAMTFEELRIRKSEDFPELESGKTVSWRVRYGAVTKSIADPKETTIAKVKEEIERSKTFLDGLKRAKSDKDKNPDCLVSPVVIAKSKGVSAYAGVFPTVEAARASDKVLCILPAQDGQIYEMRKTEMGEFIAPKHKVIDFAKVRAGFTPALPLIPRELMGQIISFFRCFMNEMAEYEAMVFLYWDRQKREFVAYVPKQRVSKASIHADLAGNTLPEDRYLHYADIHSHNSMAAEFSAVDDEDERATRLYIVIGRLDQFYPDITARVSCGGTYLQIDPHLVMEGIGEEFPPVWLDQVDRMNTSCKEREASVEKLLLDRWSSLEEIL